LTLSLSIVPVDGEYKFFAEFTIPVKLQIFEKSHSLFFSRWSLCTESMWLWVQHWAELFKKIFVSEVITEPEWTPGES